MEIRFFESTIGNDRFGGEDETFLCTLNFPVIPRIGESVGFDYSLATYRVVDVCYSQDGEEVHLEILLCEEQ